MSLIEYVKYILHRLFSKKSALIPSDLNEEMTEGEILDEEQKLEEEIQKFRLNNIIFSKLDYLEQYINIFSLTFPKEYEEYLNAIQSYRDDYERELDEYRKGLYGMITFSIDPERETKRYVDVVNLENEIQGFINFTVNYQMYKERFSKLCYKFNIFYNTIINTDIETSKVLSQVNNASVSLKRLVEEVSSQEFFKQDSRKKEEMLNHIVYCEYIIFKSFIRCSVIKNFEEYKTNVSKLYSLFVNEEYSKLIFKFLLQDLEAQQDFITNNLKADNSYQYVLRSCQNLQNRLDDYTEISQDNQYFEDLIKLENTIANLAEAASISFSLDAGDLLNGNKDISESTSINRLAIAILNLIDNEKAKLLKKIISKFTVEISWREFYFLTMILELRDDVITTSSNTVFSVIKDKFLKIQRQYTEYTPSYIEQEKKKILSYSGNKSKKYISFITCDEEDISEVTNILMGLYLDFLVINNEVYLNHSYFNGFKNLERNFGAYKIF